LEGKSKNRISENQWLASFNFPVFGSLRQSPFDTILRSQAIDTIILMGHATSGVILSTVRLAADLDYHLIVVEDGCADRDPDVHTLLMEKVFPRQATVVSAAELVAALAA